MYIIKDVNLMKLLVIIVLALTAKIQKPSYNYSFISIIQTRLFRKKKVVLPVFIVIYEKNVSITFILDEFPLDSLLNSTFFCFAECY